MKLTLDMPIVAGCAATDCAYSVDQGCHARAITIGDRDNPRCDTFLGASSHTRSTTLTAGVGACKVSACSHNEDFECTAENIGVGMQGGEVHCLTFHAR